MSFVGIEGDEVLFVINICRTVAGDDRCAGVAVKLVTIILGYIFLILLSDFRARWLRNIPTSPMTALTDFSRADVEINVYPLPESWYFISTPQWWYLCSCTNTIFILCSATDAVSSGSWLILLKVIMLSVAVCTVFLHLSNFCLGFSFVVDFFEHWGHNSNLSWMCPLFTCTKGDSVWT